MTGDESPAPMLTIIDDDGYKKFAKLLLPIVKEKNIPISTAIVAAYANGESEAHAGKVMDWDEIQECYLAGAEILSHTYCHLSQAKAQLMTDAEILEDYRKASDAMISHGFRADALVFAGGSVDETSCVEACKKVFSYGFKSSGNKINLKGSTDPYKINRYSIDPSDLLTEENLTDLVNQLATNGTGWMVWMIHTSDSAFQQEQADILAAVIDYASSQGVEIVTVATAVQEYF